MYLEEKSMQSCNGFLGMLILIFVVMIFSSFNMIYGTFQSVPWLQFAMGSLLNSYLLNMLIVLFYVTNYVRLRDHYSDMQFKFKDFITGLELDQMNETLHQLALYFSAICQCFLYRVLMRIIAEIGESSQTTYSIIMTGFYLSETVMLIGICISIKQSVLTASQGVRNSGAGISEIQYATDNNKLNFNNAGLASSR
jgi:F0F1-type ATP synthase membrane subunit c/vacuolar-type H+-ATPase subunit K